LLTSDSPGPPAQGLAEQPTPAAQLKIKADPARVKVTARRWGTAEGTVPPAEAHHLINMVGILGSVITGITGAVLTMRIGPRFTPLALAELGLALASMLLITVCCRHRDKNREQEHPAVPDPRKPVSGRRAAP
jgi:hypothetical protein